MFINYTKKKIYLAVPKTGTTSIQTYLIENLNNEENISHTQVPYKGNILPRRNMPKGREGDNKLSDLDPHLTLQNGIDSGLFTKDELEDFSIYAIIRDPVDRFLSFAYHQMQMYYVNAKKVPEGSDVSFAQMGKTNNDIAEEYLGIIKGEIVSEVQKWMSSDYVIQLHNVIGRPQSDWLIFNDKPIDKLFSLDNCEGLINDFLGEEHKLTYRYRSEYRNHEDKTQLDDSLLQEIKQMYYKDFELYNEFNRKP